MLASFDPYYVALKCWKGVMFFVNMTNIWPTTKCNCACHSLVLQARTDSESLMAISWTADGTQLAAAGGTGAVCFGRLVGISAEGNYIYANVEDVNKVVVHDIVAETKDELDFRDRVIWMSLGTTLLACCP